ncbi:MAG: hypothetical protein FJ147_12525 [Deltaproteobacteria bacterium]|nr:hypothetical protein [Deltaproteobacteria bacterium]
MKARPAKQEKTKATVKRVPKQREQASVVREAKKDIIDVQPTPPIEGDLAAPSLSLPAPVFVQRNIVAPDGSVRSGWEMWIGDHCFGRADSKDLLLASFQRLQSPPESFHWREVRNRMQMRGRPRPAAAPEQEKEEGWEENEKEEPLLLGEEVAEGFQELTWENPA